MTRRCETSAIEPQNLGRFFSILLLRVFRIALSFAARQHTRLSIRPSPAPTRRHDKILPSKATNLHFGRHLPLSSRSLHHASGPLPSARTATRVIRHSFLVRIPSQYQSISFAARIARPIRACPSRSPSQFLPRKLGCSSLGDLVISSLPVRKVFLVAVARVSGLTGRDPAITDIESKRLLQGATRMR